MDEPNGILFHWHRRKHPPHMIGQHPIFRSMLCYFASQFFIRGQQIAQPYECHSFPRKYLPDALDKSAWERDTSEILTSLQRLGSTARRVRGPNAINRC